MRILVDFPKSRFSLHQKNFVLLMVAFDVSLWVISRNGWISLGDFEFEFGVVSDEFW